MLFLILIYFSIVSPQRGRVKGQDLDGDGIIDNPRTRTQEEDDSASITQQELHQTQLTQARQKFNNINNENYKFQYQKSCFCPICDIQSMNIVIKENEVSECNFAEGNEYALTHFCFNNQEIFDETMIGSEISIDDIFDEIQSSIDNGDEIGVIYHEDIGIPLSISIDRIEASSSEETEFIAINCFEFDTNFPSPVANTRGRGRGKKNRNTVTIEEFNTEDPYSCLNIEVPSVCGNDFFKCYRYSDGCNTCTCDDDGNIVSCTKRFCDEDLLQEERCVDCESNTEWTACGGNQECIPDCDSPDDFCGFGQVEECNPGRCECPQAKPRWDGEECITEVECEPESTNNGNIGPFCVQHCEEYTDGCTICQCDVNGFIEDNNCVEDPTQNGIDGGCIVGSAQFRGCIKCEDEETMEYTQCGGPDKTCESLDTFTTISACVEKCQCKPDFPIYDPELGKCVTADVCDTSPPFVDTGNCIEHCPVYFNGCNACQCPDLIEDSDSFDAGLDFCTNLECPEGVEFGPTRTCFRCELNIMEYTWCGKCDRTCDNPSPNCLNDNGCIEKCQCPLDRPIYHDGECIVEEECPDVTDSDDDSFSFDSFSNVGLEVNSNNNNDDGEVGSVTPFNQAINPAFNLNTNIANNNNNAAPKIAFAGATDEEKTQRNEFEQEVTDEEMHKYRYEEYLLYIIIGAIVIVAGILLALWPCCIAWYRRQYIRKRSRPDKIPSMQDDERYKVVGKIDKKDVDEVPKELGVVKDQIKDQDSGLSYLPDGTVVDKQDDNKRKRRGSDNNIEQLP